MFEYCSYRHTSDLYAGTVDCVILDPDKDIMLLYSIVSMGGQWMQLHVVPPARFEDFASIEELRGKNLKQVLQAGARLKGYKGTAKCVKAQSEDLLRLVRQDAAELTPADLASLETIIAEVF